jgi:hypothetical protein
MSAPWAGISRRRVVIGAGGVLLALFGLARLLSETAGSHLLVLAVWLVGALVLHDAVLSPVIIAIGVVLRRVPEKARSYVQGALVAGAVVTVVAIPLVYRAGTQPEAKAILDQDFRVNLTVLLALILLTAVVSYLLRAAREHHVAGTGSGSTEPVPGDRSAPAE